MAYVDLDCTTESEPVIPAARPESERILWFLLGVVIGGICCALLVLAWLPHRDEEKFQFGYYHGVISGGSDVVRALHEHFGDYDWKTSYTSVIGVKASAVVAIETSGVKTVRVIP